MAPKTALTVKMTIEGVRETLRAFNQLPKDASTALREESLKLAELLAARAKADGKSDTRQAALVADTIRARKDRTPSITVGGTRKLGRRRTSAYKILFGSVFGSDVYSQFGRPHGGRNAYWFFPVVEQHSADIGAAWRRAADEVIRRFSQGTD